MWLGCSDSRVPETTILGFQPGDVLVHRNIANIISPTDINTSAVIEFAVLKLKVQHIILCGHSNCGGPVAVLGDARLGGVLDTWITPLRSLKRQNSEALAAIKEDDARAIKLSEMNVETGVNVLMGNHAVQEGIKSWGLQVHGCFFDIPSGKIRDLGYGTTGADSLAMGASGGPVVRGKHGMLVFRGGAASMNIK